MLMNMLPERSITSKVTLASLHDYWSVDKFIGNGIIRYDKEKNSANNSKSAFCKQQSSNYQ